MAATVLETALEYGALGWHILPGMDKRPFVKWAEASCEEGPITRLWEQYPYAEILVLCGPSRLGVLDYDAYKEQVETFDWRSLPATWSMTTPRGGYQFLFADPGSVVPTTAGLLHPHVDTRGVGGLIVLPGPTSPGRRWAHRSTPRPQRWPSERFGELRAPAARLGPEMDDEGRLWTPVETKGERLPNERCPGPGHTNGDQVPSLGIRKMPDGTIRAECWSGCDTAEVQELLIEGGRYTLEDFTVAQHSLFSEDAPEVKGGPFITRDELMALEPPTWMIEPFIQENALIMLAAKFNTGKTFVAVNWALELASIGKKVLYVALEGLNGLQSRVRAWEEHYERPTSEIRFSPRGYSLNLLSSVAVDALVRDIEAAGGFDLVVIDNLGEAMPGDENDSETVARSMYALNQIRNASGGAVLDLHNSGHGTSVRARGHSKMLDVHDTVIYLESIEGSINGLKVISGKERNAERFIQRRAQLKPVGDSLVAVMGARAVAESDPYYNAVKTGHQTVKSVERYLDVGNTTAERHLKELVESGSLTVLKMGRENTYHCAWDQILP
jgi:hypothetical protein